METRSGRRMRRSALMTALVVGLLATTPVTSSIVRAQGGPIDEVGCGTGVSGLAQTAGGSPEPEASGAPVIGDAGSGSVGAVAGITLIPPSAAAAGIAAGARSFRTTAGAKPAYLTPYLGSLVFSAREDARGRELWIATPTTARRLKDIAPGATSSSPRGFVILDGIAYFSADDGTHGRELWRTDGTNAGTRMVKDIRRGSRGSNPGPFVVMGDRIYFGANDGAHGYELWRSDGTSAGTRIVKDINTDGSALGQSFPDEPIDWAVMGERLYFQARRTFGELWRTDGTNAGTRRVASKVVLMSPIATTGSRLYYMASDDDGGCALNDPFLFTSDGTTAGTRKLTAAPHPGGGLAAFRRLAMFGSFVERANGDISERPRLWRSEGTNATTVQTRPTVSMDSDTPILSVGGRLFVSIGGGLAMSNATGGQVTSLGDTAAGWRSTMDVASSGGRWYFPAGTGRVRDLWRTQGSRASTRLAIDINPRGNDAVSSLVSGDGVLWFVGTDGIRGQQLWRYVPSSR